MAGWLKLRSDVGVCFTICWLVVNSHGGDINSGVFVRVLFLFQISLLFVFGTRPEPLDRGLQTSLQGNEPTRTSCDVCVRR